jgi:hypothetical protein
MIVVRRNEFLIQRPIRYLYYLTKRHGIHTKLANTTLCRGPLDEGRTMVFSGQILRLSGIRLKKSKFNSGTREERVAIETDLGPRSGPSTGNLISKRQDVPAQTRKAARRRPLDSNLMISDQAAKANPPCHQLALRTAVVAM